MGKIVAAARPIKAGATTSISSRAVVNGAKTKESRNSTGFISADPVGSAAKSGNGNGTVAAAEGKKATGVSAGVNVCTTQPSRDCRPHHKPYHVGIEENPASP